MQYDNVYELLEAIRTYELKGKERIRPCNSIKGTEVGYCTADSDGPSTRWVIPIPVLKEKAPELVPRLRSFQDRRKLLDDVRSGKFDPSDEKYFQKNLEDARKEDKVAVLSSPDLPLLGGDDVEDFLDILDTQE